MLSQNFFLHGPKSEWLWNGKEEFPRQLKYFCGLESEASYQGFIDKKHKEFQDSSNDNFGLPYSYMRFGLDDKGPTAISILLKKASSNELKLAPAKQNQIGVVAFTLNGESYKGSLSKHPLIKKEADALMGELNREQHHYEAVLRQLKRDFTFQKSVEELRNKLQGGEISQSLVQLENGHYKEFKEFYYGWASIPQDLRKSLKLQADKDAEQSKDQLSLNQTLESISKQIALGQFSDGIRKILEEYGEANLENFLQDIKFSSLALPKGVYFTSWDLESLCVKKEGADLLVKSYYLPELYEFISLGEAEHHQQ